MVPKCLPSGSVHAAEIRHRSVSTEETADQYPYFHYQYPYFHHHYLYFVRLQGSGSARSVRRWVHSSPGVPKYEGETVPPSRFVARLRVCHHRPSLAFDAKRRFLQERGAACGNSMLTGSSQVWADIGTYRLCAPRLFRMP